MDDFLHKTIGPLVLEKFVISSIIVFFSGWTILLFLVFGGRRNKIKWESRRQKMQPILQKQFYSLLFEDLSDELWKERMAPMKQLKGKQKKWALEILLQLKRQYTGFCGERMVKIFEDSGWKHQFMEQLQQSNWHEKSKAIRTLAEMDQLDEYSTIQPFLIHENDMVRDESAVAMIRLKGFRAILDLQKMEGKLSEWSQIQIIQALKTQEEQEKKWIYPLVVNSNPSLKQLGQRLLTAMDPEEYVITTLEQTK
ncbi:MAG: hypothetical protein RIS99_1595 [Bacteroidota bacterium]|jgi:hypothetical protein